MKRVLIIAYFFPPCGGGGVQRSSKFVKYLPHFNWKPFVLTVRKRNMPQDYSLLKDIPSDAAVYETFSFEELFIRNTDVEIQKENKNKKSRSLKGKRRSFKTRLSDLINTYLFHN